MLARDRASKEEREADTVHAKRESEKGCREERREGERDVKQARASVTRSEQIRRRHHDGTRGRELQAAATLQQELKA